MTRVGLDKSSVFCTLHKYKRENAVTWYANYAPSHCDWVTDTVTARPGVAPGNGSIHKLLLYYRPHNMGLCLRHASLFLTYVLAPLCAISNFNCEQVNLRNFPAAMLLHGRLSFRKPVLPSPSSGLVHRAFPIKLLAYIFGAVVYSCKEEIG